MQSARPTYARPTYARPTYARPTYARPTYARPTYARPTYARKALGRCLWAFAASLVLVACQETPSHDGAAIETGEAAGTVLLNGTVRTAVGEVPVLAHVHIDDASTEETLQSVEVSPDGTFEIGVTRAGSHRLKVTAVDHEAVRIPLVLQGEASIEFDISLRRNQFLEAPELVMAVLEVGEKSEYVRLESQDDGSWGLVVEDLAEEELRYHVIEVSEGGWLINSTLSDTYAYDGGGDYYSVVAVENGRAEIGFDPSAVPPASEEERPRIESSSVATVQAFQRQNEAEAAALAEQRTIRERGEELVARVRQAKQDGDREGWLEHYDKLVEEFGDNRGFQRPIKALDPRKRIDIGKTIPEFELALLGGNTKVSDQSLRGSYVLIDFWATWCVPCIGELPQLHKAWETWGGEGFQILSLSFDESLDDIQPFRDEHWAMPWLHAFVEGGKDSELSNEFGIYAIPYPILVDPQGTVVATMEQLRGEAIHETLAKILDKGEAG